MTSTSDVPARLAAQETMGAECAKGHAHPRIVA